MDYPLLLPDQLKTHLRSLRKARGVTQAELGAALGVGQARVAEIERDPTAISVDQLLRILACLRVQLVLHDTGLPVEFRPAMAAPLARDIAAATPAPKSLRPKKSPTLDAALGRFTDLKGKKSTAKGKW